jgi:hypothetical protein
MGARGRLRKACGLTVGLAALLLGWGLAAPGSVRAQGDPAVVGQWSAALSWPIVAIHSHVLPNGKVLLWDGDGGNNARVWDPAANTWLRVPLPGANLFCSAHAFLPDGRLLVSGGHIENGVGLKTSFAFDYRTNSWTPGPAMNDGRWYPSNVTLPTGELLVTSGSMDNTRGGNPFPQVLSTSGKWRTLSNAQLWMWLYPMMHVAPNGKVFVSGPDQMTQYLDTAGNGAWTNVGYSNFSYRDFGSSVMYEPGKVLLFGGHDPPTNTSETIDLNQAKPAWQLTAPMAFARRQCNGTVLADGRVLATGGTAGLGFNDPYSAVYAAELWDPATGQWATMASAAERRLYHSTAFLLPDGRVVSAGGGQPSGGGPDSDHYSAEVFSPPYLFKGARPKIVSAPVRVGYGQQFKVRTKQAGDIAQVTWVRLSSVTHSQNQNQRFNRLPFTRTSGGVMVTAPAQKNLCPPGHYMMFLLNGRGVPSVASIIQIQSGQVVAGK